MGCRPSSRMAPGTSPGTVPLPASTRASVARALFLFRHEHGNQRNAPRIKPAPKQTGAGAPPHRNHPTLPSSRLRDTLGRILIRGAGDAVGVGGGGAGRAGAGGGAGAQAAAQACTQTRRHYPESDPAQGGVLAFGVHPDRFWHVRRRPFGRRHDAHGDGRPAARRDGKIAQP